MGSERARTAAAAGVLFLVNAVVVARLFGTAYTTEMGSIEGAFIGLARYIRDHFPQLGWFPLWYGGIPWPDSYPPLLHITVAALSAAGPTPGLAYHFVTAVVYALIPVTLFWAALVLGAPRMNALLCALFYSLLSPSCWLIRELRADTGGWFGPRRLVTLVRYGEGPHLLSLLFLPLAVGALHLALTRRRPVYYVGAGLAVAGTVLCNWIGGFALALAVGAYLLAGYRRALLPAAGIGVYAYALAMPWVSPSTVATIRANAPLVGGRFEPNYAFMAAFAMIPLLLAWVLKRAGTPSRARLGILYLAATAIIVLGAYWFRLILLPQPQRYHLEMDMALWLAIAVCLPDKWPASTRYLPVAAAMAALPILVHQARMARGMIRPIEIEKTAEYRVATWLERNFPGRRVFPPGTIGFWMTAFSDSPTLTGGFDNGIRNTVLQDVNFQILAGDKLEVALDWFKAFGVDAVVGGDRESGEFYHPISHPERFHSLPELWRDGAEAIYRVDRGSTSLAHAVRAGDLPAVLPPAYDTTLLKPYLAALENPALPPADFQWLTPSQARITAVLRPEHLLSVQVAWDKGWHARVNGATRRVWGDKLGQTVVEPRCDGACAVDLYWDGGMEMQVARVLSPVALSAGLLWILLWRKRSDSPRKS